MEEKKKKLAGRIVPGLLVLSLALLIALPIVKVLTSSYTVIIKDRDMNYYRAKNLFICGNTVLCTRDPESSKDRSIIPEENRLGYYFRILSIKDIVSIEIVENESMEDEIAAVNPQYLGRYKIQLQGHEGILLLGVSKERVYGTVKFPQWGKGAVETLKGLRINSKGVRFLRSASTPEEMKRLGANYLFKQKFDGTYQSSGKVIKGYMINDRGEKHEWEAERK